MKSLHIFIILVLAILLFYFGLKLYTVSNMLSDTLDSLKTVNKQNTELNKENLNLSKQLMKYQKD